jgi:hypothetical protein
MASRVFQGTTVWNAAAFGGALPVDADVAYLQNSNGNLVTGLDRSADFGAGESLASLNVAPGFIGNIGDTDNYLIVPADVVKFSGAGVKNYIKTGGSVVYAAPQKNGPTSLVLASIGTGADAVVACYVLQGQVVVPSGSEYTDVWVTSLDPNAKFVLSAGAEITGTLHVLGGFVEVYGTVAEVLMMGGHTIFDEGSDVASFKLFNGAVLQWKDGSITTGVVHDRSTFDGSMHKEIASLSLTAIGEPTVNVRTQVGAITLSSWTPVGRPYLIQDDGG